MEYGPTAVKREMTKKISEGGKTATNPEESKEITESKLECNIVELSTICLEPIY
jgi:hypothetical protein